ALPALPVTSAALDTTGLAFRRVELRGEFDDARAFVLAGRAHQGMPGVHVITPLRLEGGGGVVLVNRGWLRAPDAATVHLEPSHAEGPVRLTGLAVPFFPKQPPEDERRDRSSAPIRVDHPGPDDRAAPVWFRPDDDAVRASLPYPVADFIVQALPEDA